MAFSRPAPGRTDERGVGEEDAGGVAFPWPGKCYYFRFNYYLYGQF